MILSVFFFVSGIVLGLSISVMYFRKRIKKLKIDRSMVLSKQKIQREVLNEVIKKSQKISVKNGDSIILDGDTIKLLNTIKL